VFGLHHTGPCKAVIGKMLVPKQSLHNVCAFHLPRASVGHFASCMQGTMRYC